MEHLLCDEPLRSPSCLILTITLQKKECLSTPFCRRGRSCCWKGQSWPTPKSACLSTLPPWPLYGEGYGCGLGELLGERRWGSAGGRDAVLHPCSRESSSTVPCCALKDHVKVRLKNSYKNKTKPNPIAWCFRMCGLN